MSQTPLDHILDMSVLSCSEPSGIALSGAGMDTSHMTRGLGLLWDVQWYQVLASQAQLSLIVISPRESRFPVGLI